MDKLKLILTLIANTICMNNSAVALEPINYDTVPTTQKKITFIRKIEPAPSEYREICIDFKHSVNVTKLDSNFNEKLFHTIFSQNANEPNLLGIEAYNPKSTTRKNYRVKMNQIKELLLENRNKEYKNRWFSFLRKQKRSFQERRLLGAISKMYYQSWQALKSESVVWEKNKRFILVLSNQSASTDAFFLLLNAVRDVNDALNDLFGIKINNLPNVRTANTWYEQIGRDIVAGTIIAMPLIFVYALHNKINPYGALSPLQEKTGLSFYQNPNVYNLTGSMTFGGLMGTSVGAATQWYRYRNKNIQMNELIKKILKGSFYGAASGVLIGAGEHYLNKKRKKLIEQYEEFLSVKEKRLINYDNLSEPVEYAFAKSLILKKSSNTEYSYHPQFAIKRFSWPQSIRNKTSALFANIEYVKLRRYLQTTPIAKIKEDFYSNYSNASHFPSLYFITQDRINKIIDGLNDNIDDNIYKFNLK